MASGWKQSHIQCAVRQRQVCLAISFVTTEKICLINRLNITISTVVLLVFLKQFRNCSSAFLESSTLCVRIPLPKLAGFLPRGHMVYL